MNYSSSENKGADQLCSLICDQNLGQTNVWGAVLLFIPYLWISMIHFRISINHFWISINELRISIINLRISLNRMDILNLAELCISIN